MRAHERTAANPVFVGVDYNAESVQVCVLDRTGTVLMSAAGGNDWRAILATAARFRVGKQATRFCGLTPRNASSGQRQADAGLSKAGNPQLRATLIETAHRLIRYDPRWKKLAGEMKARGKAGSLVAAAVANRWVRWLFHQVQSAKQAAQGKARRGGGQTGPREARGVAASSDKLWADGSVLGGAATARSEPTHLGYGLGPDARIEDWAERGGLGFRYPAIDNRQTFIEEPVDCCPTRPHNDWGAFRPLGSAGLPCGTCSRMTFGRLAAGGGLRRPPPAVRGG